MSLKALRACGNLADGALIVFEARNRLRGAVDSFRSRNGIVASPITAEAIAAAFPQATDADRKQILSCATKLEAALAGLDKIADTLPPNDLPSGVPGIPG